MVENEGEGWEGSLARPPPPQPPPAGDDGAGAFEVSNYPVLTKCRLTILMSVWD